MQVETYELQDAASELDGASEVVSEEALALIEVLGLEGQRSLINKEELEDGETVETRIPYRELTAEESRIFTACFPERTPLTRYASGPIPLRVLQVAAHAVELFDDVYVMHPANVREDPILIGEKARAGQSWNKRAYLLARWGDALLPLDELREKARAIILPKARLNIAEIRQDIQAFEAKLEQAIDVYLRGGDAKEPYLGRLSLT